MVWSAAIFLALGGCAEPQDSESAGYRDGYAAGYNEACAMRETPIERDFDNADYARGYANGRADGIAACELDRRAGRRQPRAATF
jgi:hypothetical protein